MSTNPFRHRPHSPATAQRAPPTRELHNLYFPRATEVGRARAPPRSLAVTHPRFKEIRVTCRPRMLFLTTLALLIASATAQFIPGGGALLAKSRKGSGAVRVASVASLCRPLTLPWSDPPPLYSRRLCCQEPDHAVRAPGDGEGQLPKLPGPDDREGLRGGARPDGPQHRCVRGHVVLSPTPPLALTVLPPPPPPPPRRPLLPPERHRARRQSLEHVLHRRRDQHSRPCHRCPRSKLRSHQAQRDPVLAHLAHPRW
jgi:hypothetical protein